MGNISAQSLILCAKELCGRVSSRSDPKMVTCWWGSGAG